MFFKENDEDCLMHSRSDNIELRIINKEGEIIEKLFQILLSRYQIWLETSTKGIVFIFDCANLL